ncbi:MAG: FixH family protein [Planctomycetaceae bacterium]|nr:FixH family protein [Planctomycetaceae bacterium]
MNSTTALTFQATTGGIVLAILTIIATAVLCVLAWRRSGYRTSTGLMELLRLLIVILIAVTLLQPEWLTMYRPESRPSILVLTDASRSMETRDVIDPSSPSTQPRTRAEATADLEDESRWQSLSERFDVVQESFSSSLPEPIEGTDLHEALTNALEEHDNLAAVVLASDGDWNVGESPARAASELRKKGVPVIAVVQGSETRLPDLDLVRVDAPTFGVAGKALRIPFVIDSSLPRETTATVTLTPSSGETVTSQVTIPAMGQLNDSLLWTPYEEGEFELTVDVPVDKAEVIPENNKRVVPIAIRKEELRVLLVESLPRWEYRYLRNALERDPGVEVSCLLFHPGLSKIGGGKGYLDGFPGTMDELSEYDVVFLGDVGVEAGQLTLEDCRLIKALIQSQASGLVWMPGMRGAHLSFVGTELEELYPVVLDPSQPRGWGSQLAAHMELTEAGRRSLLTQLEDTDDANIRLWETLPGFQWFGAANRARAGSEVLAVHQSQSSEFGRIPLLVTRTYGTGKVLYLGTDSAWRWREGVEDKYHYRFWGQVARWMAYQRSMAQGERMRLFYSPDRPKSGDTVALFANVMQDTGEPLQGGHVSVRITSPGGESETVRLAPEDEWGLYQGFFTPEEPGEYQMTLTSRENDATLETTLAVRNIRRERIGQPARTDVLNEIATITGGQVLQASELGQLPDTLATLPEPQASIRRLRLWCHPVWAGFLILLLGLFWTGRKLTGVI